MATTQNTYTANGSTTNFSFTFPYLNSTDVKVKINGTTQNTTEYTLANATTVQMDTAPANGATVMIFRDTNNDSKKATFYPGSAIKAEDLNNDFDQILYTAQEIDNNAMTTLGDDAMQGDLNLGSNKITNLATPTATTDGANKTYVDSTIDTKIDTALTTDVVAGSSISITDNSPSSGKVTLNVIAATGSNSGSLSASDKSKLDGIEASATADQTNAEIRAAVEAASDSNVFTDADHTKLNAIEASATADQTAAEIRTLVESATDSNVFTDADHTKLNGIDASATADQTASEIKTLLQSDKLTDSEIATGTLDNRYYTETELNAGQLDNRYYTETESDARYFNISTGDTIKDGDTFPDNDTTIATTAAINDRIIDLVDDVGGFVPIANETSFPNANPDVNNGTGTLVSIKALSSNLTSNGSGVATIANGTVGNSTITITGLANSTTYASTFGMIVETTSTLNTYTFHRLVPKATEVSTVSGSISNVNTVAGAISNVNSVASNATNINTVAGINANVTTVAGISSNVTSVAGNSTNINAVNSNATNINTVAGAITNVNNVGGSIANVNTVATNISGVNDFADRYRVASSDPSSNNDAGDLVFNTTSNELRVYNGSAWQGGVTATGDLLAKSGGQMTGNLTFSGSQTVDGRDVSADGTKLDGIAASANNYTHPNHSGEVTSTADGATVVTDNIIDEANLKVSNSPTNGQFLSAQSGNTGGLTWATPTSYTHPNHSGEVTSSADGAQTIANDVVDEANLKVSNSPTNGYFLSAQSGNTGGLTWAEVSQVLTEDGSDNLIAGDIAGNRISGGSSNLILGDEAGRAITSGSYSIVFGRQTMGNDNASTTGGHNIAMGYRSMYSATSAEYNVSIGREAGTAITTGSFNVLLSREAGERITTGDYNISLGRSSGYHITEGSNNITLGYYTAGSLTTGTDNICLGRSSGGSNLTTGARNVCIGYGATPSSSSVSDEITLGDTSNTSKFRVPGINFVLKDNGGTPSVGQVLTADGSGEGYWATIATGVSSDSNENTVGGTNAGNSLGGSANDNTLFGYEAGDTISATDGHTCFGYKAGDSITTGNFNICLGAYSDPSSATASGEITIGSSSYNTKFRVPSSAFYLKNSGTLPSDGQVLTADANGEATWEDAAGGGGGGALEFVSKTSVSSSVSQVDITSLADDSVYLIIGKRLKYSASAIPWLYLFDGSNSLLSGSIDYTRDIASYLTANDQDYANCYAGSITNDYGFEMKLSTKAGCNWVSMHIVTYGHNGGCWIGASLNDNSDRIGGIRLKGHTGTIESGSQFLVYKYKES